LVHFRVSPRGPNTRRSPCLDARSAPRCEASVIRPQESEPGPAGSHETALKKFLSVSELALDRKMAATYILGPFRLDAETDTLFRGGEPISLGHRAVALLARARGATGYPGFQGRADGSGVGRSHCRGEQPRSADRSPKVFGDPKRMGSVVYL
jgi:hypothetical protein